MSYQASGRRYETMIYNRCGNSGLMLPALSLGLWHNFGGKDSFENSRSMVRYAFDAGITHFDLANNYGPPPGSAEETFGEILKKDLLPYRDELVISSKAGYEMWPGPYGNNGSRKYLIASLDQSLKRMGLEYVDIFYHHRPDPETPLEESMQALDHIVRQGKALYVGISSYSPEETRAAAKILKELGTPCLIHQPIYSMLKRDVEKGLLDVLDEEKIGAIAFSPLAQGLLTDRYLNGIPDDSRISKGSGFLTLSAINDGILTMLINLNAIAEKRGQTLAQMALSWVLRRKEMTSVIIGASRISQIEENLKSLENLTFLEEEESEIEQILSRNGY
ncbi:MULTISPECIES: L-glyceraldehyde 3-phosphate reductase [Bacillus]|uniref:L-glyceraldehyde 3-phosphate reductase n=2 Tax=Bacillus TaxID=1386 RepID=A0A0M4FIX0_9BACI|nr:MULTISPECIES: L-glyceraldehyde 3-phosphate reductase [Bacillus]ALC82924.1 L-glyceraldehyde 3-phosphate reductase [Bacillus gobiensis]MBP1081906.1 L-glyceraldehyde 3-phosphate reductase [Bacillus capparidis]MED1096553.1 L-glyceraldehyde 3-phosphate reductase [Bacillus capparidis]